MAKMLLMHNSDQLFNTLKPPTTERPLFYWYTDRFVSFQGTQKYIYLFLIEPRKDGIEVRSRSSFLNFDMLHKNFLHYKGWCEGKHPEWCTCGKTNRVYEESGVVMTFNELRPDLTLMARSYGSSLPYDQQTDFEIIQPHKPFTKRTIKLFDAPYNNINLARRIRFIDIPEIVDLLPDLADSLPYKDIEPDSDGIYHYDQWLPMVHENEGSWT